MWYVEDTRGIITASKLKAFILSPKLYKVQWLDESPVCTEWEDESWAELGEAFHYLVEVGIDKRSERYQVTEKFLKDDLIAMIKERDSVQLKKDKVKLPELRKIRYGEDKYNQMKWKIEMTPSESDMIIWMYESIYKQPLRDMAGTYTKERRFKAKYGILNIGFKPDRICFFCDGEQFTVEDIDAVMATMSKEARKQHIIDKNMTCLIRDFKTSAQLDKMVRELRNDNETSNGYVLSMSFYYACIYALYGVESDVYIDVVEKTKPYKTDVISIPRSRMKDKLKSIIKPALEKLIECTDKNERPEPTRDDLIQNKSLAKYFNYFDSSIQKTPTMIDMML